jgi:hypothetical protein
MLPGLQPFRPSGTKRKKMYANDNEALIGPLGNVSELNDMEQF